MGVDIDTEIEGVNTYLNQCLEDRRALLGNHLKDTGNVARLTATLSANHDRLKEGITAFGADVEKWRQHIEEAKREFANANGDSDPTAMEFARENLMMEVDTVLHELLFWKSELGNLGKEETEAELQAAGDTLISSLENILREETSMISSINSHMKTCFLDYASKLKQDGSMDDDSSQGRISELEAEVLQKKKDMLILKGRVEEFSAQKKEEIELLTELNLKLEATVENLKRELEDKRADEENAQNGTQHSGNGEEIIERLRNELNTKTSELKQQTESHEQKLQRAFWATCVAVKLALSERKKPLATVSVQELYDKSSKFAEIDEWVQFIQKEYLNPK
eukprot:GFYU01018806.1.p1 GENE.GFYU01018806.1~~GFYU01018806.1.p1  ORF type:complete len:369 (+),score=57.70 GFYU01018806.1:95-1108(+)